MIGRNIRTLAFVAVVAVILACAPVLQPSVIQPTLDPLSLNTAIAQTVAAAGTQTAVFAPPTLTPSPTLLATNTPTELPSLTPTFIFILATPTVPSPTPTPRPTSSTSNADFDCRIVSQTPKDNATFNRQEDFDARWHVANIGQSNWNGNSTDYRYVSGDQFHQQAIYDLPRSVPSGGEIDIIVDMKAPGTAGTYSTTWRLRAGKTEFCSMRLTIVVE